MARLEGGYQQIDQRLGAIEADVRDLRGEIRDLRNEVRVEIGGVRGEIGGLRGELGNEIRELRGDMRQQFYWVIGLIVTTILVPIGLRFLNP